MVLWEWSDNTGDFEEPQHTASFPPKPFAKY